MNDKTDGGVIARLLRLFKGRGTVEPRAAKSSNDTAVPSWEQLEFEQRVRALVKRSDVLLTANVHLLGLTHLRNYFKENWALVAEKVHSVVTKIIQHHLGEDGTFYCYQDLTYIIVFAGASKEAGKLRVALIADEVSRRLFGEVNDGQKVEVKSAVLEKGHDLDFETVDFEAIIAHAMEEQLAGHRTEVGVPRGKAAVARNEGDAAKAAATAPVEDCQGQTQSPQWETIRPPGQSRKGVVVADGDPSAESAAPVVAEPVQPGDWASTSPYASGVVQFVFRPMWLVRRRMIRAYMAVPVRVTETGALLFGADAIPTGSGSGMNAGLDFASLRHVAHALAAARPGDGQPDIVTSVHFITVTHANFRSHFQALCHKLPRRVGQRMIFELVGLPRGTPQTRLYDVIPLLRIHNPTLLLRLPPDTTDFRDYAAMGFRAVGIDGHALTGPESATIKYLGKFSELAARQGLPAYVHGLRSRSLISAAVTEGFEVIGGEAVASAGDGPEKTFPFDIKDLYEPLLSSLPEVPDGTGQGG